MFGAYDDGSWSEMGEDFCMMGLTSQGPFKRIKHAPSS